MLWFLQKLHQIIKLTDRFKKKLAKKGKDRALNAKKVHIK